MSIMAEQTVISYIREKMAQSHTSPMEGRHKPFLGNRHFRYNDLALLLKPFCAPGYDVYSRLAMASTRTQTFPKRKK